MGTKLPLKLSTSTIYTLWSSEPESLKLIDARPRESFERDHIPGSDWVEASHLETSLSQLDPRKLVVLICDFEQASEALLKEKGIQNAVVLKGGFLDWQKKGFPTFHNSNRLTTQGDSMKDNLIFHQLFEHESSTYTYLLADKKTKEAVLIDPVIETIDRDLKLIHELGLNLKYVLDTHVHADHVTAAGEIRNRTRAKTAVSMQAKVKCVDIPLEDGQQIQFGDFVIKAMATPGHTDSCMSFYTEGMLFTGDAILVRGTGRTDFQGGSAEKLYDSITAKIFSLPEDTAIFPGHDYRGHTSSTIAQEKEFNPRIGGGKTKEQFVQIMKELKLANPKKIHEALPANMACGIRKEDRVLRPQVVDGIPEVTCEDVNQTLGKVRLIDVRRPEEFNNEYGHIKGAELVTLGDELMQFLEKGNREEEIVFVCRSGGRSGQATAISKQLGYTKTVNMVGGMIRWNELKQEVVRD